MELLRAEIARLAHVTPNQMPTPLSCRWYHLDLDLPLRRNARFVDNEYLAKLLSLKGGSKMKAVYVDTKRQLDMVRKAQAGGFCKEVGAPVQSQVCSRSVFFFFSKLEYLLLFRRQTNLRRPLISDAISCFLWGRSRLRFPVLFWCFAPVASAFSVCRKLQGARGEPGAERFRDRVQATSDAPPQRQGVQGLPGQHDPGDTRIPATAGVDFLFLYVFDGVFRLRVDVRLYCCFRPSVDSLLACRFFLFSSSPFVDSAHTLLHLPWAGSVCRCASVFRQQRREYGRKCGRGIHRNKNLSPCFPGLARVPGVYRKTPMLLYCCVSCSVKVNQASNKPRNHNPTPCPASLCTAFGVIKMMGVSYV